VILLACLGYMGLNRARLKMQIRQRTAQEGQRLAEAETKRATELLDTFRQHLVEKNMLIEKMQTDVLSKDNAEDHTRRLSELANHLILTDEDWTRFKSLFDSVYPAFFLSLRNKVPDITQSEQRMAALSKLKLTAKEAANLLGVSPNTIYTTKRRLRQRLGLENDAELDPFLEIIRE
jgi:DNA-binding CsgD family transcriptional regulator